MTRHIRSLASLARRSRLVLPSPVLQPPAGPNLEFVGPHAQASSSIPWVGLAVAGLLATPVAAAALSPDPASEERAAATRDLVSGTTADREAAVSLLSRLTRDPDGHAALLATGALPALVHVVTSREIDSQVRVIALGCVADLLAYLPARQPSPDTALLLDEIAAVLQARNDWGSGPGDGAVGRAHAARVLQHLLSQPEGHASVKKAGALDALLARSAELAKESAEEGGTYPSLAAVPGNLNSLNSVEEERALAAALYGLTGSELGVQDVLVSEETLRGLMRWVLSQDPLLQRAGAGAVARIVCSGPSQATSVADLGGFAAVVASLACSDPQARCYAAAAVRKVAQFGGPLAGRLAAEPRLVPVLLACVVSRGAAGDGGPAAGAATAAARKLGLAPSGGGGGTATSLSQAEAARGKDSVEGLQGSVRRGVQRCGLMALAAAAGERQLALSLTAGGAVEVLRRELAASAYAGELEGLARDTLALLEPKQ
ncbi:hypothetical protein ACKKBF_B15275 [Auxenochlorella protothecoides x Auxenochlorella symbiontica]